MGVVYTRLLSGHVIVGLMVMFCPHDYRQGMLLLLLCCYFVQFQRQDNYVAVHYFRVVFTTSQDDCSVVSVLVLI